MNEPNHLSHRILELSEDRNGMTEMRNWTLRGKRRVQRSAVHVEGMKRWLSQTLTLGKRNSLGIGVSGYRIRVVRWLPRVFWYV